MEVGVTNNNYVNDDLIEEEDQPKKSKEKPKKKKENTNKKKVSKKKEKAMMKEQEKKEAASKLFNNFYTLVWKDRWKSLSESLKAPNRHCCLVNLFAESSKLEEALKPLAGKLKKVPFIKTLALYLDDDIGITHPFPAPVADSRGIMTHYLLDASSLLAVEALGVNPDDEVLDLCAAPGGKSVTILQLLFAQTKNVSLGSLTANELASERRLRLKNVIHNYLPMALQERVSVTGLDGTKAHLFDSKLYDKILLDAPCSSDRHLLHDQEELNKWTPNKTKSNSKRQYLLLMEALKMLRPDGNIIYATCSISDEENDRVVEKVLKKSRIPAEVIKTKWGIGEPTIYGWLVLPDSSDRWGPLYFCLLRRLTEEEVRERDQGSSDNENDDEPESDE